MSQYTDNVYSRNNRSGVKHVSVSDIQTKYSLYSSAHSRLILIAIDDKTVEYLWRLIVYTAITLLRICLVPCVHLSLVTSDDTYKRLSIERIPSTAIR